jgi:hypothetical protein
MPYAVSLAALEPPISLVVFVAALVFVGSPDVTQQSGDENRSVGLPYARDRNVWPNLQLTGHASSPTRHPGYWHRSWCAVVRHTIQLGMA